MPSAQNSPQREPEGDGDEMSLLERAKKIQAERAEKARRLRVPLRSGTPGSEGVIAKNDRAHADRKVSGYQGGG